LIDFAGQSIALANLKITPQLNTFRANRYIVMQSVDDFSAGFLAGPKDRIRKSPYIIDMNNFRQFFIKYPFYCEVNMGIPLFNQMPQRFHQQRFFLGPVSPIEI
jgi:hypothetical protein